jgi:putative ABC transport system permease protein
MRYQSKALLGADLVIKGRRPFGKETLELIRSLGGEQSRQVSFSSMAYFPKSGSTRLAMVRALEGDFPFYGALDTDPRSAAHHFKAGSNALVDDSLMLQFDAEAGDSVIIGAHTFRILGRLKKIPGEALAAGLIRPRVYIPMSALDRTELIRKGSIARYRVFFKFEAERDTEKLVRTLQPHLRKYGLEVDTVQKRKERLGRAMGNLSRYLGLVGCIALLLGGVGVASGIHVHTTQKIGTVALLRCVGAKARQTFAVYLIQATAMGLAGACLGILIGLGVQMFLPMVLRDFLPMEIPVFFSWRAILAGVSIGLGVALLFALLPLLSLRKISPLLTLRSRLENTQPESTDPLRWFIYSLIAVGIGFFAVAQTEVLYHGLVFAAGVGLAFGLITGIAKLLMTLVKTYFSNSWSYVWRQGLANLYRPNNQTVVVMLSIGLGAFLIVTVQLTRNMLLEQVSLASGEKMPNMVLFDIQTDQTEAIRDLLATFDLRTFQETPIVTMRLISVKGRSAEEIRNDPDSDVSNWALTREYRSTYRSHLTDTETIAAGSWRGIADPSSGPIEVSLEERIAKDLDVTIGDELTFDVYGIPFTTRVGSVRDVNWQRMQPNFFVVFPTGAIEDAPQFYVFVTRVPSNEISARLQRAVVQKYPNVSAIDLNLILNTVDTVLSKVSFAINFISLFSVLTGLTVLIGAVISSRYQRLEESVLLRTFGASRGQIRKIILIEYLFLGSFAATAGIALAVAASWALAYYFFEAAYAPDGAILLIAFLAVTGITVLTGMSNSRGICNSPPLEVLRSAI